MKEASPTQRSLPTYREYRRLPQYGRQPAYSSPAPYTQARGQTITPAPAFKRAVIEAAPARNPEDAIRLFQAIPDHPGALAFDIDISAELVQLAVVYESWRAAEVEAALRGSISDCDLTIGIEPTVPPGLRWLTGTLSRDAALEWGPLATYDTKTADPLQGLFEAGAVRTGQYLRVRYLVRRAPALRIDELWRSLEEPPPRRLLSPPEPSLAQLLAPDERRVVEQRLSALSLEIVGRLMLGGSDFRSLTGYARSLTHYFRTCFDAGYGRLELNWRYGYGWLKPTSWLEPSIVLTAAECAALYHLPSANLVVPGLTHRSGNVRPAPTEVQRGDGPFLGTQRVRSEEVALRIPLQAFHSGPTAVIGQSGVGKSELLKTLSFELVQARARPALIYLDPDNDAIHDLAAGKLPPQREKDVVLLDVADSDFPFSLSLSYKPPDMPQETFVESTMAVWRAVFGKEYWGPQIEDVAYASANALSLLESFLQIPRLFEDAVFRRRVVSQIQDPTALEFWSSYETLSPSAKRELPRAFLRRVRSLSRAPAVRNLLGQKQGLDFGPLLDAGAILLVGLYSPSTSSETELFLELLLARLHAALLTRLTESTDSRRRGYLLLDESQRAQGATLGALLRGSRKLAISTIVCSQYIDAWGESMREALIGNAACQFIFRVGATDARRLAGTVKPFEADDLEALRPHECVGKLRGLPAFNFVTRKLPQERDENALSRISARTRTRYARPRADVEDELNRLLIGTSMSQPGNSLDIDED